MKFFKKIFIIILVLLVVFVIYFCAVKYFYPDMTVRSQFGDMFGGLNTLFSALAFLGVIYTVFLQREELILQRKELELTRKELKRTAEAQEKSEKALSKQAASLKITAKLNGKSSILQHYNTLIELTNSAKFGIDIANFNKHKQSADAVIGQINELIKDK